MDIRSFVFVITSLHHFHTIFNHCHYTFLEYMATQPITSSSRDFDCFPLDLLEKVRLATTPPSHPIPSKWDVLETPIQYTFLGWKCGTKCFTNTILPHLFIILYLFLLPKANNFPLLGKCLSRRVRT